MTTIYLAMVDDLYTAEAYPFSTPAAAISFARNWASFKLDDGAHEEPADDRLYNVTDTEGNCAWVVAKELDAAA